MSWVRQYLVLHTGNRIDAVLGRAGLRAPLKLPPRYFEHRPTGVLVARVHGVETIREFLSGAAVTLMLDVPFLLDLPRDHVLLQRDADADHAGGARC